MPARMRRRTADGELKEHLRLHTADILHRVFRGYTKMVAAELGVSANRIYNQTEGQCANGLELLARALDRVVFETGDPQSVAPVLAFLAQRYRTDDTPGDGVEDELADVARSAGELIGRVIEMAADGLTETEAEEIERLTARHRELVRALATEAGKVAGQNGTAATH